MEPDALLPSKEAVEAILDRDCQEIPSFPVVAVKLLNLARDERSSATDLARVVTSDPALVAKVLKVVNSAAYGLPHSIASVNQAIVILGFSAIRSLALGLAVFQLVHAKRSQHFDEFFFWKHCLAVAELSRALAEEIQYPDPEEAYVAGLLHDIGKIILNFYGRISYGDFLHKLSGSEGVMVEEERKVIGLGHDEVGAYFCANWGMPERLVHAIQFHHSRFGHLNLPKNSAALVAIVALANFLVWIQGLGSVDVLRHSILQPEVEKSIDLDGIDLHAIIQRMDRGVKRTAEFYNLSFPSSNQLRENLLRANLELCRVNTRLFYGLEEDDPSPPLLRKPPAGIIKPFWSIDSQEIVDRTLGAIHEEFSFDRLYVMEVDSECRNLRALGSKDTTNLGMDLSALQIALDADAGGFLRCLRQRVPVLITGKTQRETEVLSFLRVETVGIVPLSNNDRSIGIIGVDNVFSGRPIHLGRLAEVAITANELGMALEHIQSYQELTVRANTDALTKTHNRGSLDHLLAESWERARQGNFRLSVALLDVDLFKLFNDAFGHLAGDSILKLLSGILNKFSRPNCPVGRFGGEEFLTILNNTDATGAVRYAERIRAEVEGLGQLLIKRFPGHRLTVSIGVATYRPDMSAPEDLILEADQALYLAKETGRNKVRSVESNAG